MEWWLLISKFGLGGDVKEVVVLYKDCLAEMCYRQTIFILWFTVRSAVVYLGRMWGMRGPLVWMCLRMWCYSELLHASEHILRLHISLCEA